MSDIRPNIRVCPGQRDRAELPHERFTNKFQLYFYDYNGDELKKLYAKAQVNFQLDSIPRLLFIHERQVDYPESIFEKYSCSSA